MCLRCQIGFLFGEKLLILSGLLLLPELHHSIAAAEECAEEDHPADGCPWCSLDGVVACSAGGWPSWPGIWSLRSCRWRRCWRLPLLLRHVCVGRMVLLQRTPPGMRLNLSGLLLASVAPQVRPVHVEDDSLRLNIRASPGFACGSLPMQSWSALPQSCQRDGMHGHCNSSQQTLWIGVREGGPWPAHHLCRAQALEGDRHGFCRPVGQQEFAPA